MGKSMMVVRIVATDTEIRILSLAVFAGKVVLAKLTDDFFLKLAVPCAINFEVYNKLW